MEAELQFKCVTKQSLVTRKNRRCADLSRRVVAGVYYLSRLANPAIDYQWDRIITRHKQKEFFIMVDALKFFKSGCFTIANVVHTKKNLKLGDHWIVTRIEQIENKYRYAGDIDLMVIFPQPKYIGKEKEIGIIYKNWHCFKVLHDIMILKNRVWGCGNRR